MRSNKIKNSITTFNCANKTDQENKRYRIHYLFLTDKKKFLRTEN